MNDTSNDTKQRDREIARNENTRQTIGAIRVSLWAIAVALIAAVIGWFVLRGE